LESKLVPLRKQVAELVEARKADKAQVSKLEKKSTERDVLLVKSSKIGIRRSKN